MCLHDHHANAVQPPAAVARRNVLAGAAVLAGVSTAGVLSSPSAQADPGTGSSTPRYRGRPPRPGALIITGGALVDPRSGHVTQDAVVVLDGGVVLAAGSRDATRAAVAKVTGRARTIEVFGKWVVPGLVDVHVHINALADAKAVLRAGATTVRSGSSNFYQDVALRPLAEWAPGLAPRMRAAGVFVSPELGDTVLADPALAPLAALAGGVRSTSDLAYVTRVNLSRGVDVIKTRTNPRAGIAEQDPTELVYDQEQISAVVSAAGRAGVLCHAYSREGIDGAVRAGVRSIEHGVFVGESTLDLMARRGTYFTPTTAAIAGLSQSPNPVLAARGREYMPVLQAAIREAHARGVTVVAGTDSFGTDVDPIGTEVRLLVEAGLTPLDALRGATVNAAELIGWSKRVGRLAPGYHADVVVVDGNPLEDGSALERVKLVVAQGAVVRNEL
ncbi:MULTISPECIES: amidohydrolase family protein [unclassified Knoellia]|uniref:amidohydrolase family protein n=1 Tax=Knoellia altitudinis TaxID=3404795 RepID=UPI00360E06F0